ncbi:unnamed protein product [Fraxinus pennsylvanica]|uniref:S1-like domain-containing protein n=1 Tax=Fraxinus pennsylvanica TaxID=56036 RepID=A0AAD1ZBT0_9LAMI|nr:unnamed protein product [Fraxinus pennsylvanica]
MLGNCRLEAMRIDGVKRLCHIRGKMHKKVWISAGDIILVGLRDYQDNKADVILSYSANQARLLKAYGELPENMSINVGIAGGLDKEDDGAGYDYFDFQRLPLVASNVGRGGRLWLKRRRDIIRTNNTICAPASAVDAY